MLNDAAPPAKIYIGNTVYDLDKATDNMLIYTKHSSCAIYDYTI